jgi:RNA polymerase sigma-70 factor (ECF subfamily)
MASDRPEPADAELVRRALAGDREAFEAIYRRYEGVVYRFARSMSGSRSLAEDVTQEVFVALMRDLARYEPDRAGLATYLYGVARNVTRARLRREQRFVTIDARAGGDDAGRSDPSTALTRSQDLQRLRAAILALPCRFREVVILCDLQELSYADAGRALGVSIGTVRSRLHRGRTLLAARLRCEAPDPAAGAVRCPA